MSSHGRGSDLCKCKPPNRPKNTHLVSRFSAAGLASTTESEMLEHVGADAVQLYVSEHDDARAN